MLGADHVCAAQAHLRRLSAAEMVAALRRATAAQRAECLRTAGLRLRPTAPVDRVARLLLARLRTLDGRSAHNVVVTLTDGARTQMMAVIGDDEDALVDDVARGLDGPLGSVPPPLLAALFALLCELGAYPTASRDALLGLLEQPRRSGAAAPTASTSRASGESEGSAAEAAARVEPVLAGGSAASAVIDPPVRAAGAPLDRVLTQALLRAHGRGAASELEMASRAVDELLALDGNRHGSWWLRGLADGLASVPRGAPSPPTPQAAERRAAGLLTALARAGDDRGLAAAAMAHPAAVERIVTDAAGADADLVAPLLGAVLEHDVVSARSLLGIAATRPFPAWPRLLERLGRVASRLADEEDLGGATSLLRAADDMLTAWTPDAGEFEIHAIEQAAAELAVARVSSQRRAGDFQGARSVLSRIDIEVLAPAARKQLADEAALVAFEVASLHAVAFPRGDADRDATRARFDRALGEVEHAVAHGTGLPGRVLRALGRLAHGHARDAVADLQIALGILATSGDLIPKGRRLRATMEFQLGLHQLCLLDAGTDETALQHVARGMSGGYCASADELTTAAVALDAHASVESTTMLQRALELAPGHTDALDVLAGLASRGVSGAVELAAAHGSNERLPRRLRFELLEAALTGSREADGGRASTRDSDGQAVDLETLADDLERLVARAADSELDDRWAARLGADDRLRSRLGADTLDLVRLQVLRRAGRTDDAAAAARGLFHRSLSGHVEGVDPADLLDLLGHLAVDDAELAPLRRLLPSSTAGVSGEDAALRVPAERQGAPTARVVGSATEGVAVLFVGGDETQDRAWPAIERELADRYGGTVTVERFATGWGSNWAPWARAVESRYPDADAVVLMTFVRTMLGRRIRRTAGEAGLPWIACTGHGQESIRRAIDRAVGLAIAVRGGGGCSG